jgi:hypothetical protein
MLMADIYTLHYIYIIFDIYKLYIGVWNLEDGEKFETMCKLIAPRYDMKVEDFKEDGYELKFFRLFSYTC